MGGRGNCQQQEEEEGEMVSFLLGWKETQKKLKFEFLDQHEDHFFMNLWERLFVIRVFTFAALDSILALGEARLIEKAPPSENRI